MCDVRAKILSKRACDVRACGSVSSVRRANVILRLFEQKRPIFTRFGAIKTIFERAWVVQVCGTFLDVRICTSLHTFAYFYALFVSFLGLFKVFSLFIHIFFLISCY